MNAWAVIINSEGEKTGGAEFGGRGNAFRKNGALHLRTLHSLNDISSDQSNTVVFAIPLERKGF